MKAITDSMVVMMPNSHRRNPGSNTRGSQIYSLLLPQNWQVGTIGGGGGVQVTLADSCRIRGMLSHGGGGEKIMLLIAAAKYRSTREAYN